MSESNTKQMIQLNHVKFGYSDTEVLEEINLTIHEGEYVVLTGENGSGKSTLMRLILGEMKPDEGEIILRVGGPVLPFNSPFLVGNKYGCIHLIQQALKILPPHLLVHQSATQGSQGCGQIVRQLPHHLILVR